ncbi:MAG TPA: phosphatidate cytidylyltransferase [Anaeromyxobacteraceae bacterium]|nr:phosphatidate cytidylyltransferase [Anaeromyxobacteraceae bacterium]
MSANMLRRVAFAAVAIPVALAVVWAGGWWLTLLVSLVAVLGVREVYRFAHQKGTHPFGGIGLTVAALVPVVAWAVLGPAQFVLAPWLLFAPLGLLGLLVVALAIRRPDQHPMASVAITWFGVAYAAVLPSFLLVIRHAGGQGERSWPGVAMTFFPLVVVWTCDTAAMFAGKSLGGPKLAPVVSPGKTWSGTIAGALAAVAIAPAFDAVVLRPQGVMLELWQVLLFGAVLGVVGQVGDLAESLLKREAGMKDSSDLIPGHGGVLDRFDSLYFVLPTAAVLYRAFGLL